MANNDLTGREREVLELFSCGSTYPEVARLLSISVNTVREHVRNVYCKLDVSSKIEAVLAAARLGNDPPVPPSQRRARRARLP
jgi:DNA-binding NarL/FixJ family response regulator